MSQPSRRSVPSSPASAPDLVESTGLALSAAAAERREADARVAELDRSIKHMEDFPLEYPETGYPEALDKLRHARADAVARASRAAAKEADAAKVHKQAKDERAVASRDPLRAERDATFEHAARYVLGEVHDDAVKVVAAITAAVARVEANSNELRAAHKPVAHEPRSSLAFSWPAIAAAGRNKPEREAAFIVLAGLARWLEPSAVAAREREDAEFVRQRQAEREKAARHGHYGRDAQEAQFEKDRAELRRSYPGAGALSRASTTTLDPEVRRYRENAGLDA